jgi:hypothetical protein
VYRLVRPASVHGLRRVYGDAGLLRLRHDRDVQGPLLTSDRPACLVAERRVLGEDGAARSTRA